MALANVLFERNPNDLKLGYLTVLTIMAERNKSTAAMTYFHPPRLLSFSLSWMISNVSDETSAAAEGIGKPRKSLLPPPLGRLARQLNRASRNAPQIR